jgi:peptide deformylase
VIRRIVLWPEAVLTRPAAMVMEFDRQLEALAEDMLETMYAAPGRGLAAPQIGVSQRVFVMDTTWKEGDYAPRVFVNPVVLSESEEVQENAEGCLSLPDMTTLVTRPIAVTMRWQDVTGGWFAERLTGFSAICAQHEFDHLDGILTIDRIDSEARELLGPELALLRGRG